MTLTEAAIVELWALSGGYTPVGACGCEVECTDGVDLNRLMALRVSAWYNRELSELPAAELPTENIAERLTLTISGNGAGRVSLPDGILRVVGVEMDTWERPAVITHDGSSVPALAQSNPFSRGGRAAPVAVVDAGLRVMHLYTPTKGGRLTTVAVVRQPDEGTYRLTDAMLARLPRSGDDFFNDLFLKNY